MMDPQEDLRTWLAEHQVGGVVRGAFAAGKLSGKYFRQPPKLGSDDIRSNWFPSDKLQSDFTKFAAFEALLSHQRTMPQLALRFLLDRPTTHTIILGAKSFDEYRDAARATALPPLTQQENDRIAQLRKQIAAS
jgi:aryl-alcohol dehydrogenase-like predicted oxidoreductase